MSVKLLVIGQQPRYVVSDDTSIVDVEEYFLEQYGKHRERQMQYQLQEIPEHSEL